MSNRLWIASGSDPEMELIERLLREAGERVVYALGPDGRRVRADNAYRVTALSEPIPTGATVYRVECDGPAIPSDAIVIDHHRPGDPGYGRPPAEFLAASSIGQVIAVLGQVADYPAEWQRVAVSRHPHWCGAIELHGGVWAARTTGDEGDPGQDRDDTATAVVIPTEYVLAAAADHCLAAAYRGECPGVDPDALMRWRAESRAAFQRRPVEDVLADVERAREALRAAPYISLDGHPLITCARCGAPTHAVHCDGYSGAPCDCPDGPMARPAARDMRGQHVPELPEASAREGECFVADGLPGPDGRVKVVCQSGSPEQIEAFMRVWAPAHGLTDIYGDPARGFAGGYLAGRPGAV